MLFKTFFSKVAFLVLFFTFGLIFFIEFFFLDGFSGSGVTTDWSDEESGKGEREDKMKTQPGIAGIGWLVLRSGGVYDRKCTGSILTSDCESGVRVNDEESRK